MLVTLSPGRNQSSSQRELLSYKWEGNSRPEDRRGKGRLIQPENKQDNEGGRDSILNNVFSD